MLSSFTSLVSFLPHTFGCHHPRASFSAPCSMKTTCLAQHVFTLPEVQDEIFFRSNFSAHELSRLTLVSRTWYAMVKPALWRSIHLQPPDDGLWPIPKVHLIANAPWIRNLAVSSLEAVESLTDSDRCIHLRQLSLCTRKVSTTTIATILTEPVMALISQNSGLKIFCWKHHQGDIQQNDPLIALLSPIVGRVLSSLHSLKHLETIDLEGLVLSDFAMCNVLVSCKRIMNLRLRHCFLIPSNFQEVNCFKTVRRLEWHDGSLLHERSGSKQPYNQGWMILLSACSYLHDLSLASDPLSKSDLVIFLSHLCTLKNLKSLALCRVADSDRDLGMILKAAAPLKRLCLSGMPYLAVGHRGGGGSVASGSMVTDSICTLHCDSLSDLRFEGVGLTSKHYLEILSTCRKLRSFSVKDEWTTIDVDDMKSATNTRATTSATTSTSTTMGAARTSASETQGNRGNWACVDLERLVVAFYLGSAELSPKCLHSSYPMISDTVQNYKVMLNHLSGLNHLKHVEVWMWSAVGYPVQDSNCWDSLVDDWKMFLKSCSRLRRLVVHMNVPRRIQKQIVEWSCGQEVNGGLRFEIRPLSRE